MADGGGQGLLSRKVPSVALDRLFLELHDQLPTDARGKLAQLADEMKRLNESRTEETSVTPTSSEDRAVLRREEEIATTQANQSSVELQARGKAQGTPGNVGYNFSAGVNSNVAVYESRKTEKSSFH